MDREPICTFVYCLSNVTQEIVVGRGMTYYQLWLGAGGMGD
jgi:hypothetical protein